MSKTKNKNRSEVEHLQGQIRQLERENRQLKRRNKELEKRAHFYEDVVEEVIEDIDVRDICPQCNKGLISILDLNYVKFETCTNDDCEYRKKI